MAKKKRESGSRLSEEEQFRWLMATAYVLSCVGLLNSETRMKLDSLDELGAGNWRQLTAAELGVGESFIRSVYALCTEFKDSGQAIGFILRGFGCPNVDMFLRQLGITN